MKSILLASTLLISLTTFAAIDKNYTTKADKITQDDLGTSTLSGHAELKQGAYKLTARAISINPDMGSIVASGDVKFDNGTTTTEESQMIFKVENGTWNLVPKK